MANIIVRMERCELGETEGELLRMYEAYDDFDDIAKRRFTKECTNVFIAEKRL